MLDSILKVIKVKGYAPPRPWLTSVLFRALISAQFSMPWSWVSYDLEMLSVYKKIVRASATGKFCGPNDEITG